MPAWIFLSGSVHELNKLQENLSIIRCLRQGNILLEIPHLIFKSKHPCMLHIKGFKQICFSSIDSAEKPLIFFLPISKQIFSHFELTPVFVRLSQMNENRCKTHYILLLKSSFIPFINFICLFVVCVKRRFCILMNH